MQTMACPHADWPVSYAWLQGTQPVRTALVCAWVSSRRMLSAVRVSEGVGHCVGGNGFLMGRARGVYDG